MEATLTIMLSRPSSPKSWCSFLPRSSPPIGSPTQGLSHTRLHRGQVERGFIDTKKEQFGSLHTFRINYVYWASTSAATATADASGVIVAAPTLERRNKRSPCHLTEWLE
jgi:hypothetical protein